MRHIIAGNGIIGLTVALRLLDGMGRGDEVRIIGPSDRPGSATLAAGAMLNSFAELEHGSLDHRVDQARFALSRRATGLWPSFAEDVAQRHETAFPGVPVPRKTNIGPDAGTFIINNCASNGLDDRNFDAIARAAAEHGEPHALVPPAELPNYAPEERHRALRALHLPQEGWINPRAFMQMLQPVLASHPAVTLVDSSAVSLRHGQGVVTGCETSSGEMVEGDTFIVATGASTTALLLRSQLGISVQRVFYGVGVTIEIDPHEHVPTACIRTPNRGLACGVYAVPFLPSRIGDRTHLMVGASNFISPTPYPHARLTSLETLVTAASSQINRNFYRADFIRANVGWRPTSTDTYPLVGRSSLGNLLLCTGTKRDGFHLSPLISRHIAGLAQGTQGEPGWEDFAPERALIRTLTRAQAIEKAVEHHISAAYQHGFQPPQGRLLEATMRAIREDAERVHDLAGADDWGIPPEMLDMHRYGHATQ